MTDELDTDDIATEEVLDMLAEILDSGTVDVRVHPDFLRSIAEELRGLRGGDK